MSGFAAVFRLSGSPVDRGVIQRVAGALAYRGPDGVKVWCDGPIGLAHCHFWTTPEDVGEEQPISAAEKRFWLAADARIDNRSDLMPALTDNGFLNKRIPTDAEIILAAYRRWGEECVKHLIGDFSFVVWDAPAQRLFMARDVIGLRQLYYTLVGGVLYVANTIAAILAALPRQPELNRWVISQFLVGNYEPWLSQTFYTGLYRLPPSHCVAANQNGLGKPGLYYIPNPEGSHQCSSDQEWLETYRRLLTEAVRCRLRSRTPVAIAGGGGLDSSSIACVAHELVQKEAGLPAMRLYSWVYPQTPSADESVYLDALLAHCPGLAAVRIPSDRYWALRDYVRSDEALDEPDLNAYRRHLVDLLQRVAADGQRVVLFGNGGDHILCQYLYYEPAALRGVPWGHWLAEAQHFHSWSRMGWLPLMYRACIKPAAPAGLRAGVRSLLGMEAKPLPWVRAAEPPAGGYPLNRAFFSPPGLSVAASLMYQAVRRPYDVASHSMVEAMSASAQVEARSPFWDRRLLDFMIGAPHRLRAWQGMDRVMARESLRSILPEAIRLRTSKSSINEMMVLGLRREEQQRIEDALRSSRAEALGFISVQPLADAFAQYCWAETDEYQPMLRALYLELWLRHRQEYGKLTP